MENQNDRMGLLMGLSDIALVLSTYGVLAAYNFLIEPVGVNTWIICSFFLGIKILLLGIADITGIGRHLWVRLLFIILADGIILVVNQMMAFGLASKMLLIMTAADFILIILAYLIWKKQAKKEIAETEERRQWIYDEHPNAEKREKNQTAAGYVPVNNSALDQLFEEEEPVYGVQNVAEANRQMAQAANAKEHTGEIDDFLYNGQEDTTSIFQPIQPEQLEAAEQVKTKAAEPEAVEEEENFSFDALTAPLPDTPRAEKKTNPAPTPKQPEPETEDDFFSAVPEDDLSGESFLSFNDITSELPAPETIEESIAAAEMTAPVEEAAELEAAETVQEVPEKQPEDVPEAVQAPESVETPEPIVISEAEFKEITGSLPRLDEDFLPLKADLSQSEINQERETVQKEALKLDGQLDALLERFNERTTQTLGDDVATLSAAVDALPPLTADDDIKTSGQIIRGKLRNIIDKQFVMEDVLSDLIDVSNQLNTRASALDTAEENLKARQAEAARRAREQQEAARKAAEAQKLAEEQAKKVAQEKARAQKEAAEKAKAAQERARAQQAAEERAKAAEEKARAQRAAEEQAREAKRQAEREQREREAARRLAEKPAPQQKEPGLTDSEVHLKNGDMDIIIDAEDLELLKEFLKQQK